MSVQRLTVLAWLLSGLVLAAPLTSQAQSEVLWLHLNEGIGTNVYDSSTSTNDGTVVGDAAWAGGKCGYGLEFDGTNIEYADVGTNASLSFADGDAWTFEAWLRPNTNANWQPFVGKADMDGKYLMLHGGNGVWFKDKNYSYHEVSVGGYGGEWLHVAVVADTSTNLHVYRDGEYCGVAAPGTTEMDFNIIGCNGSKSRKFAGVIDEVRVFDEARTAGEISNSFAAARNRLLLHFSEGGGDAVDDASLYENDGTVVSNAAWVTGKTGYGLEFDGTNVEYVDVGTDGSLSFTNGEAWTFEAWLKPNTNDDWRAFVGKDGSEDGQYLMLHSSNAVFFRDTLSNDYEVTIGAYGGEWLHAAVVAYPSGEMAVYRGGEYQGMMAGPTNPIGTEMAFNFVGCNGAKDRRFAGIIDDVRVTGSVDAFPPLVTFVSPTPSNEAIDSSSATVSVTVDGPAVSRVILVWEGNEEPMGGEHPDFSLTKTDLAGRYDFKVYAVYTCGATELTGETEERWVYVTNAAGITVWALNNLSTVKRGGAPVGGSLYGEASIKAAKNEVEPFQVIVSSRGMGRGVTNVNVTVSDLTNVYHDVFSSNNLALYREHYVEVTSSSPASPNGPEPAGWFPDALIPFKDPYTGTNLVAAVYDAAPFDVAEEENQPVWIEAYVPTATASGVYSGTITISADNEADVTIPLVLDVWNFTLPERATQKSLMGVYTPALANAHGVGLYSSDYFTYEELYSRFMIGHRIMPQCPYGTCPSKSSDGSLDFGLVRGTKTAGEWLAYYFDELNATAMNFWFTRWYYYDGEEYDGSITNIPFSTTNNLAHMTRLFTDMHDYYEANGWLDRLRLYVYDEPSTAQAYTNIRDRAEFLHNISSNLNVLVTKQPDAHPEWLSLVGYVDTWVPIVGLFDYDDIQTRVAAGDEAWSYTVRNQDLLHPGVPKWYLDYPVINCRVGSWINRSLGANGVLKSPYGFPSAAAADIWEDPGIGWGGGTTAYKGYDLYPGTSALVGFDGPVATIRFKQLREGAEDFEYMQMLSDLGQGAFVTQQVNSVGTGWSWENGEWSEDPATLLSAREAMGNRIDEVLSHVPAGSLFKIY